jgi:hypothetical protein
MMHGFEISVWAILRVENKYYSATGAQIYWGFLLPAHCNGQLPYSTVAVLSIRPPGLNFRGPKMRGIVARFIGGAILRYVRGTPNSVQYGEVPVAAAAGCAKSPFALLRMFTGG